ncbi:MULTISPECIES: helix-turn-helix transcriptional regulator [Streptomyces]|uniref:helix-turn-helix transcriptional regulator n=1 Tax=Streptomyces TaxID=1883 RepID=UPI00167876D7|nr:MULTISPECIES: helix-turn-helix transcriptional regulator [Streptomyces]MBK3520777.1 helix-turn-helix domain-containing protein [Streptomyces sp. MBT70]GGR60484.1 transcriptional regulator [Streptomyces eurythermus]
MDDLADFLRTRRARVRPESVGIRPDSRRRVTGLRREEVAHLSGVSVDYYVRLEQGRARQPSVQVLDALARVLGLDDVEREHLHRLARRVVGEPRRATSARPRPELLRVLELITDAPAFLIDHRLTVLAANRLGDMIYSRPAEGLNIARHLFLTEEGRALFADWENCTLDVVGHLRLAAGRCPGDRELAALIGELAMHSERFRQLWARADVRTRTHGRKAYHHPAVGHLELHQENFALPDVTGTELIVQSAAPGTAAHDNLRLLASLGATAQEAPGAPVADRTEQAADGA